MDTAVEGTAALDSVLLTTVPALLGHLPVPESRRLFSHDVIHAVLPGHLLRTQQCEAKLSVTDVGKGLAEAEMWAGLWTVWPASEDVTDVWVCRKNNLLTQQAQKLCVHLELIDGPDLKCL